MKRYQIYYDGYDKPFCQMDTVSGETFDADGQLMKRFPDFVYEQWERGAGRIEEDCVFESEPTEATIPSVDDKGEILCCRIRYDYNI